jgi:XTP/dITP diphosphohydrolase
MGKRRLFFGTGNAKKLKEINEILGDTFEIVSFKDLLEPMEVEETESTLEGNAKLKALAYAEATGLPCFADDSGLEVEALDGAPGVDTAHYAGPQRDAHDNMDKLLQELAGKGNRTAYFRTVIAYYDHGKMRLFEGSLKGKIGLEKRGREGFGYDPIFIPEGETRTLAEMSAEEKNAISHRGHAVRQLAQFLLHS